MKRSVWIVTLFFCGVGSFTASLGEERAASEVSLLDLAERAYQSNEIETGHIHLNRLIESNPGDVDLARESLERILSESRKDHGERLRQNRHLKFIEDSWAERAAHRLCSLERLGVVASSSPNVRWAVDYLTEYDLLHGRHLASKERIDYFVRGNPHDPFWRIVRARFHRRVRSPQTVEFYEQLRDEIDLDHPDPIIREQWTEFSDELKADTEELPRSIQPLPERTPLSIMDLNDPDGEWLRIRNRRPNEVATVIDRVLSKSFSSNHIVVWNDESGWTDSLRALDLHLASFPAADLEPIRRVQASRFRRDPRRDKTSSEETLALFRRFPWASGAHQRLLESANRTLFSGRAHSAARSFRDILDRTTDESIRTTARVGYWAALAQTDAPLTVESMLGGLALEQPVKWLGQRTTAGELCKQLLANREKAEPERAVPMKDLVERVVRLPAVSPWNGESAGVDLTSVGGGLLVSARSMLALYDADDLTAPKWSHLQRHPLEQNPNRRDVPGYFRPALGDDVLFTRWGFGSVPSGVAALDFSTGQPLWSNEDATAVRRREFHVPLGDPVLVDGCLVYLQWNSTQNVNHNRGRRLSLVCYDPRTRSIRWENTLVEAGQGNDLLGTVERARPDLAIYGNRLTIHSGSIYANTNCGVVARSDVRDGRTEWAYCYQPRPAPSATQSLGAAPLIVGDRIICMPRDSGRVFALDNRTGRVVWDNPFVTGVQLVGTVGDLVIVRGRSNLVGMDSATGVVRWHQPLAGPVVARARLVGSSLYVAQVDRLLRIDASTGLVEESRAWGLKNERPTAFLIRGRDLFVVTDRPTARTELVVDSSSNGVTSVSGTKSLEHQWTLHREQATVALPPTGSPLKGRAYVISEGMLECLDLASKADVLWKRMLGSTNPRVKFLGSKVLVFGSGARLAPGTKDRVRAFDGKAGGTLWERGVSIPIQQALECGATLVLHDGQGRLVGLDGGSGRRVWSRDLAQPAHVQLSYKAEKLHIFYLSRSRTPHHLLMDVTSGGTIRRHTIERVASTEAMSNAVPLKDGYYEVKTKPVRARYIRLVALSEVNGQGWASMAELQLIGPDGKNLPRKGWKITASSFETKHKYGRPELVLDGDWRSWWHTPWMNEKNQPVFGGIVPHPHELRLDLGSEQTVAGLRYLPGVIVNNNGMIRDYEFYTSTDPNKWGAPLAKGVLVYRMRVDRAIVSDKGIFFQTGTNRWLKHPNIYRYALDEKPVQLVRENAQLTFSKEPYWMTTAQEGGKNVFVVHRFDDPKYRFVLGPTNNLDAGSIEIVGDRLVMARRSILVADLARKKVVYRLDDPKNPAQQNGSVVVADSNHVLKIVPVGAHTQKLFLLDLTNGDQSEFVVQNDPIRQRPNQPRKVHHFGGLVLMSDDSTLSAYSIR